MKRWWTFLKAWTVWKDVPKVSRRKGKKNLAVCLGCDARRFVSVETGDYTEKAVLRGLGVAGRLTVWCGMPGKPDKVQRTCGCWLGAEAEATVGNVLTELTVGGHTFEACAATMAKGKTCDRGLWSN